MQKEYLKNLKITHAPKSVTIIEGEIPKEILEKEFKKIFAQALKTIEVPGFRAGKAPENLAKNHINEMAVLDKAAEEVFKIEYPQIIESLNIFPIQHPQIQITKLAIDNPLGFKITVITMPKIDLPDYKKIAKKENKPIKEALIEEKDVELAIKEIQKMYAHQKYHQDNPDDKGHNHSEDLPLPEINDEFVQKLGQFKDIADFREKLKENLKQEALQKEKEKNRLAIVEALVKDFVIEIPDILVDSEINKMMQDLYSKIANVGIKTEEYFKQINKTEEDIKKEWRPEAEKRTKIEIILTEIAKKENIKIDDKEIEVEVKKLLDYYKDADPIRAKSYVEHMLTNDKVFELLESF